jgi:Uncharacterized protein conserved in bacteria (DUF2147)
MKQFTLAAALLMASTAAHAGSAISFEIDGHKIRIEAPRHCDALSCLKITGLSGINLNGLKSGHGDDDEPSPSSATPPAPAPIPPAPLVQANAPQAMPPATSAQAASPAPSVSPAPATVVAAAPATQPVTAAPAASAAATATAPVPASPPPPAAAPAPQQAPVAAAPAPAPTTPLGLWATEEHKGNVRIENCGANLCGYAEKTGEKILINMRPSDNKWVGRIHDPEGGSNYDSTIAMKGPNLLKVQGCAFGGLFCGGQTWKRLS